MTDITDSRDDQRLGQCHISRTHLVINSHPLEASLPINDVLFSGCLLRFLIFFFQFSYYYDMSGMDWVCRTLEPVALDLSPVGNIAVLGRTLI